MHCIPAGGPPRTREAAASPDADSGGAGGACRACSRWRVRTVALGLAIAYIVQYGPGSHGLKDVTDIVWISELGIHYKLGVSGLNVLLVGLTALLFFAAVLASNSAHVGPPTPLLLPLHARRVGRARRLSRPGSGAVRRVLRSDADPLLLPHRRVGNRSRPRESDDQARHLHAGGLAADARRRDRHRRARRRAERWAHHVRALPTAGLAAEQGLAGVDLPVLRRRLPREDARLPACTGGCPTDTGRCRSRC